jgi:uncharacterized SAM-binding protein YcdF (DUF218 family)
MNYKIYIYGILILIIVVYVGACREAGLWLVKEDEPVKTDAVVVLMGSIADRILQTVDLYKKGIASKVIIVESEMGAFRELKARGADIVSNTEQISNAATDLGIPGDRIIILPGAAQSTQQEAMIIRDYLANKPDIDTLIVVSSAPHTRRASMIFERAFKKLEVPVYVIYSPSSYTNFNAEKWWQCKDDIETVLLEYLKIANFWFIERKRI